jgi:hypothetical protein
MFFLDQALVLTSVHETLLFPPRLLERKELRVLASILPTVLWIQSPIPITWAADEA